VSVLYDVLERGVIEGGLCGGVMGEYSRGEPGPASVDSKGRSLGEDKPLDDLERISSRSGGMRRQGNWGYKMQRGWSETTYQNRSLSPNRYSYSLPQQPLQNTAPKTMGRSPSTEERLQPSDGRLVELPSTIPTCPISYSQTQLPEEDERPPRPSGRRLGLCVRGMGGVH